jgi:hypothetical protein
LCTIRKQRCWTQASHDLRNCSSMETENAFLLLKSADFGQRRLAWVWCAAAVCFEAEFRPKRRTDPSQGTLSVSRFPALKLICKSRVLLAKPRYMLRSTRTNRPATRRWLLRDSSMLLADLVSVEEENRRCELVFPVLVSHGETTAKWGVQDSSRAYLSAREEPSRCCVRQQQGTLAS